MAPLVAVQREEADLAVGRGCCRLDLLFLGFLGGRGNVILVWFLEWRGDVGRLKELLRVAGRVVGVVESLLQYLSLVKFCDPKDITSFIE